MPTIEVKGAKISYIDAGQGEPVILLHSSACSSLQWRTLIDGLKPRYRVLAPDLFGYGTSEPWPGRGRLRLADEAAVVDSLCRLADGAAHLIGHSYGGAVALRAVSDQPAAFRSLTLIEPVAFHLLWNSAPAGARAYYEIRKVADRIWAAVTNGDCHDAMAAFVDYWNGEGAWSALSEAQQNVLIRATPKVALDFWATLTEPKILDDYRQTALPTLLLHGDRSPKPARAIVGMLGETLPRVEVMSVAKAGHMLPVTHREAVNTAIAAHLAKHGVERRDAA